MEYYEFIGKTQAERSACIFEQGQFLIVRTVCEYHVVLYDMGKFFAEVWYHTIKNRIVKARGFRGLIPLEPYLDMIDISNLLEWQ